MSFNQALSLAKRFRIVNTRVHYRVCRQMFTNRFIILADDEKMPLSYIHVRWF